MNVRRKISFITIIFIALIVLSTAFAWGVNKYEKTTFSHGKAVVDINEIKHEIDEGETELARDNLDRLAQEVEPSQSSDFLYLIPMGFAVIYVIIVFAYIYKNVLMPFEKLHDFAGSVAAGNLDEPLNQERGQYFGEFTWAFDSMRKEILKARESEKASIENNKTIIATLSHDIKTPISSIRTYSEALEANLAKTPEKRSKYLKTIIEKCDEVSRLTDDLFVHSISDMDKMSVVNTKINISKLMPQFIEILNTMENLSYKSIDENLYIEADSERLLQICENIVGNANKYAKTNIDVELLLEGEEVSIVFRDYGSGIPEENLPFITQKFYRGNNTEGVEGSGLGLYIVSYISGKMNGRTEISNVYENGVSNGLRIKISFPFVS